MLNSGLLLQRETKTVQRINEVQKARFFYFFRDRVCNFSLRSRSIGPSDFFGPRKKVVLHGEGNAWAPVSRSFDNLREVSVLSYLFYF